MGPWYPGQRWWCILDYWTQAVHIFHLILKYFKLVLPVTLFRDFSRNVSNLFHFASETCKGSIYRLIVLPTSVVGSASIVSCFFFSGCSGIYIFNNPGWFLICGGQPCSIVPLASTPTASVLSSLIYLLCTVKSHRSKSVRGARGTQHALWHLPTCCH